MVSGAQRYLLLGFVAVLLVVIPISIYLLQKQTQTQSNATKSTVMSFQPASSQSSPLQKNVGDSIPLDIYVDPGNNLVSSVRVQIQYDPTKIATDGATPFTLNSSALPILITGPVYGNGTIGLVVSAGTDPTKVIKSPTKIGTINFKAVGATDPGSPTQLTYTSLTSASSIAGPSTGSNDTYSENVISATNPAFITIAGTSSVTPTDTPAITATATPTTAAVPTDTDTPTPTSFVIPTATNTPAATGGGTACTSLQASPATSGVSPFAVTFTAAGTSSSSTISKVSFNFGDGQSTDVTDSGGVGTNTVSAQAQHTYGTGTYTATATMTDATGATTSAAPNCSVTITVSGSGSSSSTVTPTTPISVGAGTNTPTLAPTGPGDTFVNAGIILGIITIIGGILFFAL